MPLPSDSLDLDNVVCSQCENTDSISILQIYLHFDKFSFFAVVLYILAYFFVYSHILVERTPKKFCIDAMS